nr:hypothetical protein [Mesorhizobium loti]
MRDDRQKVWADDKSAHTDRGGANRKGPHMPSYVVIVGSALVAVRFKNGIDLRIAARQSLPE